MTFKKLLLSLSVLSMYGYLVMVGCGSYTQLFDPNKLPESKPEIVPIELKDDAIPQSRKDYYAARLGRHRAYRYTDWDRYTGYVFRPYPYESEIHIYRHNPQHKFNLGVDENTTSQNYTPQQTVVPLTSADAAQAVRVWQKRISMEKKDRATYTESSHTY